VSFRVKVKTWSALSRRHLARVYPGLVDHGTGEVSVGGDVPGDGVVVRGEQLGEQLGVELVTRQAVTLVSHAALVSPVL
jgi:hypothetical protein